MEKRENGESNKRDLGGRLEKGTPPVVAMTPNRKL